MVIGIDHGYYAIKGTHVCFPKEAILADTQGYDYARICAYIPDYHRLEISVSRSRIITGSKRKK